MDTYQITPYIYKTLNNTAVNIINNKEIPLNEDFIALFTYCLVKRDESSLRNQFDQALVDRAIRDQFLCNPDHIYQLYQIFMAEIETTNYCNYSCVYCPVKETPPSEKRVMSMPLFAKVLQQVRNSGILHLTLNFYNEPTLDPLFDERIEAIAKTDLVITLQTNASGFTDSKIELLKRHKKSIELVRINLPSLNYEEYQRITGRALTPNLLDSIDKIMESGLNTEIVVVGNVRDILKNAPLIEKKYSCPVKRQKANDRAGSLQTQYCENIHVDGRLTGCTSVLQSINVGVDGNVYLCSHDYTRSYPVGNLNHTSMTRVLTSPKAEQIRKTVFGGSDGDYICRKCSFMKYHHKSSKYVSMIKYLKNS